MATKVTTKKVTAAPVVVAKPATGKIKINPKCGDITFAELKKHADEMINLIKTHPGSKNGMKPALTALQSVSKELTAFQKSYEKSVSIQANAKTRLAAATKKTK